MHMEQKITRRYKGAVGESHFEEIAIPLENVEDIGVFSELQQATGIIFRETGSDYNYDWHNAPRRQNILSLEGDVEVKVGDGSKRLFGSGDIVPAEDTTGRGHRSRAVNRQSRKTVFITLD